MIVGYNEFRNRNYFAISSTELRIKDKDEHKKKSSDNLLETVTTWSCPACGSVASSQGGCRVQRQHHYRHCCSRAPVSLHSLFSIPQSSVMASEPPLGSTLEQLSRASVCGKRSRAAAQLLTVA